MIVVNLKGGLGNQMFQYAAGRALSLRFANILKLDATGFELTRGAVTPRDYSLGAWNIVENFASAEEIKRIKYPRGILSKAKRFIRAKILRQFYVRYVPRLMRKHGDYYLDGFFQTERYFKDFEAQIRKEFTPQAPLSAEASAALAQIQADPNAVSLHVRRADYVSVKNTNKQHGTCSPLYYQRAVDYIATYAANPHLYIFSDDIAWVKENMHFGYPQTFLSTPTLMEQPHVEMVLMTACRHNVIANSSYSWWGAWLNANPDKIVVAPKRWVRRGWYRFKDITPSSWTRLK